MGVTAVVAVTDVTALIADTAVAAEKVYTESLRI